MVRRYCPMKVVRDGHNFANVSSIVILYTNYARALTFENFSQQLFSRCPSLDAHTGVCAFVPLCLVSVRLSPSLYGCVCADVARTATLS